MKNAEIDAKTFPAPADQDGTKRDSYHHGDLRAQLIEATRHLVETKGPDRFSVSEACRLAGVSTAAPYKHFRDKAEMLSAVARGGMERQYSQLVEELAPFAPGTVDRIVALGRVYTRFALAEPGVFRLMFGLAEQHGEDQELVKTGEGTFGLVQQEVALCRGSTEIEEIDRHRAFLLWSFVHGLSFLRIDGKLAAMDMTVDVEYVLRDVALRVLSEQPPETPADPR